MFRDSDMHDRMVAEFESHIGKDADHTEEKLAQLATGFGIILFICNFEKQKGAEKDSYCRYKQRWGIETHYNFVENIFTESVIQKKLCTVFISNVFGFYNVLFHVIMIQVKGSLIWDLESKDNETKKCQGNPR